MPRKTKAVKQEPQVDIGAEIFASLRELEKLKGIPVDYMVERLKQALTNAYRRDREDHRDVPADNVVVDLSEKGLSMQLVKTWPWRSPWMPPGDTTPMSSPARA